MLRRFAREATSGACGARKAPIRGDEAPDRLGPLASSSVNGVRMPHPNNQRQIGCGVGDPAQPTSNEPTKRYCAAGLVRRT